MSYSDLIHRYFEGELEGEDYLEAALFNELHNNPDARQDFRDMLQIRSLCQEDMVSITTPSDCTTSVFAQLGFQMPTAAQQSAVAAAAGVAAGAASGAARFAGMRRFGSYILTAALASAVTAATFMYLQTDEDGAATAGTLQNGEGLALNGASSDAGRSNGNRTSGQNADMAVPVSASYSQEANNELERERQMAQANAGATDGQQFAANTSNEFSSNQTTLQGNAAQLRSSGSSDVQVSTAGNQPHSPIASNGLHYSPEANNNGLSNGNGGAAITPDAANADATLTSNGTVNNGTTSTNGNSAETQDDGNANSAAPLGVVISSATSLDDFPPLNGPVGITRNAPEAQTPIGVSLSILESKLLSVSFRRIASSTNFAPDVVEEASGNTMLLNNAIGVNYRLDQFNTVGVEFGQEIYGQEFATDFRGQSGVEYQQRPALYWIGVNHRYDFNAFLELPEDLRLFEQSLIGVHNAGAFGAFTGGMMRTMLGAEYTVLDRVTISAALEVSGISYSTASATEFSYNTGFTYGVAYKF